MPNSIRGTVNHFQSSHKSSFPKIGPAKMSQAGSVLWKFSRCHSPLSGFGALLLMASSEQRLAIIDPERPPPFEDAPPHPSAYASKYPFTRDRLLTPFLLDRPVIFPMPEFRFEQPDMERPASRRRNLIQPHPDRRPRPAQPKNLRLLDVLKQLDPRPILAVIAFPRITSHRHNWPHVPLLCFTAARQSLECNWRHDVVRLLAPASPAIHATPLIHPGRSARTLLHVLTDPSRTLLTGHITGDKPIDFRLEHPERRPRLILSIRTATKFVNHRAQRLDRPDSGAPRFPRAAQKIELPAMHEELTSVCDQCNRPASVHVALELIKAPFDLALH